ncbi:MAG: hypothetical protein PVG30_05710 [Gammaproteobacteria bacterium]|jgi:hypothetical protein
MYNDSKSTIEKIIKIVRALMGRTSKEKIEININNVEAIINKPKEKNHPRTQNIITTLRNLAKLKTFNPHKKNKFPKKSKNLEQIYQHFKSQKKFKNIPAIIVTHTIKPKKWKKPNIIAFIFKNAYIIKGDFEYSVKKLTQICKKNKGYLPKNIVIIVPGNIIGEHEKSLDNLLLWTMLKEQYPNQIILLRGKNEIKSLSEYNAYELTASPQVVFTQVETKKEIENIVAKELSFSNEVELIYCKKNKQWFININHGDQKYCAQITRTSEFKNIFPYLQIQQIKKNNNKIANKILEILKNEKFIQSPDSKTKRYPRDEILHQIHKITAKFPIYAIVMQKIEKKLYPVLVAPHAIHRCTSNDSLHKILGSKILIDSTKNNPYYNIITTEKFLDGEKIKKYGKQKGIYIGKQTINRLKKFGFFKLYVGGNIEKNKLMFKGFCDKIRNNKTVNIRKNLENKKCINLSIQTKSTTHAKSDKLILICNKTQVTVNCTLPELLHIIYVFHRGIQKNKKYTYDPTIITPKNIEQHIKYCDVEKHDGNKLTIKKLELQPRQMVRQIGVTITKNIENILEVDITSFAKRVAKNNPKSVFYQLKRIIIYYNNLETHLPKKLYQSLIAFPIYKQLYILFSKKFFDPDDLTQLKLQLKNKLETIDLIFEEGQIINNNIDVNQVTAKILKIFKSIKINKPDSYVKNDHPDEKTPLIEKTEKEYYDDKEAKKICCFCCLKF